MTVKPVESSDDSGVGSLGGLLGQGMGDRARRALNLYLVASIAISRGARARKAWREWRSFTVSLSGSDPIYGHVQEWLAQQIPHDKRKSVHAVYVRDSESNRLDQPEAVQVWPEDRTARAQPRIASLYDGRKSQRVRIGGHDVTVSTESRETNYSGGRLNEYEAYVRQFRKIIFEAQTPAGRDAVLAFLEDVARAYSHHSKQPKIFVAQRWGEWLHRLDVPPRPLESVVLMAGQMERIVDDLALFLASEERYAELGLPWHHGYLLHGRAGTGKTSIARALATHFGLDVYWLALTDISDDSQLLRLMAVLPPKAMVLIEDLDVAKATHKRTEEGTDNEGVTLIGLMNALDGIATPHGMVAVMTTNHYDVLDMALIRQSRVDLEEHVDLLDAEALGRMVKQFTGGSFAVRPDTQVLPTAVVATIKAHIDDKDEMLKALQRQYGYV